MVDLVALKAKLAAKRAEAEVVTNDVPVLEQAMNIIAAIPAAMEPFKTEPAPVTSTITATASIGTERTSEIDHLDFLTKVQELEAALIHTHPHMPVLLMKIHKQLSSDPELVSVLKEEEIGIIVSALKIQTKTELTGTIVKQAKSKDKKTKLDVSLF